MRCPECQHENQESNRFCGQCGALLPASPSKVSQTVSSAVREPKKPTMETRPPKSLNEEQRPAPPPRREVEPRGVSGPSFLGISESDFERGRRGEDLYGSNWGGRLGFALVILIVVGVLVFMQWKSNHPLISIFAPKPSPAQTQSNAQRPPAPGDMPAQSQANSATTPPQSQEGNGAATSSATNQGATNQGATGQSGNTAQNGSAPASPAANSQAQPNSDQNSAAAASDNAAQKSAQESPSNGTASSGGAQSATQQKEDSSAKQENTKKQTNAQTASATDNSSAGDEASSSAGNEDKPAHVKHAAPSAASKPDELQPVRQAEAYIDAQQCDRGVNMLQSASQQGNTQAVIKLGALYATGTCVPFDRVIAYHYFSRAFRVEPDNTSLDHNRIMLWNEMSAAERQRAMAEDGSLDQ